MQYYELLCNTYLKKDIYFENAFEIISKYISFCMAQDSYLKSVHAKRGFKFYTYGLFYPIEKRKTYKKDKLYHFTIRSADKLFLEKLDEQLRQNINNPFLQVLSTEYKSMQISKPISELYSASPCIVTVSKEAGYWSFRYGDIMFLQRRLHENLLKKYMEFTNEYITPTQNFIQMLEIKNKTPEFIVLTRRGNKVKLLGNKFRIIPHEDSISQKLAAFALLAGLGEKNSFGGGFCLAKEMR